MVSGEGRAHCSIVRLAKRREGFGEQSLADLANLPPTGRGAFVLDGGKRFYDKNQCRAVQKDAKGISLPELHVDTKKVWQWCQRS